MTSLLFYVRLNLYFSPIIFEFTTEGMHHDSHHHGSSFQYCHGQYFASYSV